MSATLRLGARLAVGTRGQRGRSLMVVVAAAVGALVMLAVLAIAAAEQAAGSALFNSAELRRLTAVVVVVVALPILVLAATVGRLSAALRDRRLANLRLLGLTPVQTRLVAATESGLAALAGAGLGAVAFVLLRPVIARADVAGLSWNVAALRPAVSGWLLAVIGIPAVTVAVAAIPHRYDARSTLDQARQRDVRRPSPWRLVPLTLGVALGIAGWNANRDSQIQNHELVVILGGIALTGLGIVLVVPVFVRLLADLLQRSSRGPVSLVAARRLQAQPAGVTRVIAALMVGLFLVIGARCVVVAFESTPQYRSAAANVEVQQRSSVLAGPGRSAGVAARAAAVPGVTDVVDLAVLTGTAGKRLRTGGNVMPVRAIVGTCADLAVFADIDNCSEGRPLVLTPWWYDDVPETITLGAAHGGRDPARDAPTITIPTPTTTMTNAGDDRETQEWIRPLWADVFLPESTPGIRPLLASSQHELVVLAGPGDDLNPGLEEAGLQVTSWPAVETYDFVVAMRTIVWAVAALILVVGLLTFAIAAIDRAVSRRRELVSLQVIGTPPGTLVRAQWLEAALPTTLGCVLAIAAGFFAGSTYLRLDGSSMNAFPWSPALTLAGIAVAASLAIAGLTVLATNTRIAPEHIRTE